MPGAFVQAAMVFEFRVEIFFSFNLIIYYLIILLVSPSLLGVLHSITHNLGTANSNANYNFRPRLHLPSTILAQP